MNRRLPCPHQALCGRGGEEDPADIQLGIAQLKKVMTPLLIARQHGSTRTQRMGILLASK